MSAADIHAASEVPAALTLFPLEPQGRARRDDPITSKNAAQRMKPGRLRDRIWNLMDFAGEGWTDRELCQRIVPQEPLRWQSVISARSGMKKEGLVVTYGEQRDRRLVWYRADRLPQVVETRAI